MKAQGLFSQQSRLGQPSSGEADVGTFLLLLFVSAARDSRLCSSGVALLEAEITSLGLRRKVGKSQPTSSVLLLQSAVPLP